MKKTKYYIDSNNNYIGGFCGLDPTYDEDGNQLTTGWEDISILIPQGAIEVPTAPDNALQKWDDVNKLWLPI